MTFKADTKPLDVKDAEPAASFITRLTPELPKTSFSTEGKNIAQVNTTRDTYRSQLNASAPHLPKPQPETPQPVEVSPPAQSLDQESEQDGNIKRIDGSVWRPTLPQSRPPPEPPPAAREGITKSDFDIENQTQDIPLSRPPPEPPPSTMRFVLTYFKYKEN